MSIFDKILDIVSGGAVKTIADTIQAYFPPSMSDSEKAAMELAVREAERARDMDMIRLAHEADVEFNKRIKDMEGSASDLRSLPVVGSLVLFLRGCQRPLWGFGTLWIDFQILSGGWTVRLSADHGWTPEGMAVICINLLVLGFLFGERAIQNVLPLVTQFMAVRQGEARR